MTVSKSFDGSFSDLVEDIFVSELKSTKILNIEETINSKRTVIPNIKPFDVIRHAMTQSISKENESASFLFYETKSGYNFRSLESLYAKNPVQDYNFFQANIKSDNKIGKDYSRIRDYKILGSSDLLLGTRNGFFGSNLLVHDSYNKETIRYTFNYFDNFEDHSRIDENPIYNQTVIDESDNTIGDFPDANIQLHPTSFNGTNDAQFYDTDTGYSYSDNHAEEWILSRRSRMTELSSGGLRVNFQTHGYCNLAVGEKVQLTMPVTGKDHGSSKIDTFYQGDFLVTQLRHSFDQSERKHIMYISATKDSIPTEFTNVAKSTEPVGGKGLIKTY